MSNSAEDLKGKVEEWLASEGYPLEFRTALAFRKHRFAVQQGAYAKGSEDHLREIDVLA